MQQLSQYLIEKYILCHQPLSYILSKCQAISIIGFSKQHLQYLYPLFARNIINFNHTSMTIQIHSSQIFLFHRIAKLTKLFKQHWKQKTYLEIFNKWIQNGFFPFQIQKNYQKPIHDLIQQNLILESTVDNKIYYIFKVNQLTKLLLDNYIGKQQSISLLDIQNHKKKQQIIRKKQLEKLQQYIIQMYGQNCLMVIKLVQDNKFINEKQLLNKVFIDIVELRKCLNILIQAGIISFYQQTARITIYQCSQTQKLIQIYINHISKSYLNLLILQQQKLIKPKLIKSECMLIQLDDILLLFGY